MTPGPSERHKDAIKEFIWFHDFQNRNTASVIAATDTKTYGDLARFKPSELLALGLVQDEISPVKALLAARNMKLAEETELPV